MCEIEYEKQLLNIITKTDRNTLVLRALFGKRKTKKLAVDL